MTGTIINCLTIVVGALIGTFIVKRIPDSVRDSVMYAISLAVVLIGLRTAWDAPDFVVLIISLALGALLGETAQLDDRLNAVAKRLERRFGAQSAGTFAKGFVTASLVFGVGAMAVMGALENGLTGRYDTLLAKSALDGISSIVFSSAFGIGVAFSAIPILIYQGGISLLASWIQPFLSDPVVAQMSAVGGLLIAAIGLNMLGATEVKVANLLPGILVGAVLMVLRTTI
jgi:hypothetical protein